MPKGPGGLDMNTLMAQAKKLQNELKKVQEEAAKEMVDVTVGGGMVSVKATGEGKIAEIKISKDIVDPEDIEMLEDLILSGVNEALRKAKEMVQEKMSGVTGGMGLGGLSNLI
ncbi:MAG: YbaB/EbfC family nucleoid-associated protein [Desulfurellaceae bacterium]|jgi:DNA-binding YbaB/EbfC family protein|nr:YbaB/EbfC family nucleoid-associated protein [Desulfurellaceae bacterium]